MLIDKTLSGLLLVDVQEKLTPHVLNSEKLVSRCAWLMRLAQTLSVPILVSEQYPRGLGHTVEALAGFVSLDDCIEKVHFSCYRSEAFRKQWESSGKTHIILAGIETHVCVLQTALDLKQQTDNEV